VGEGKCERERESNDLFNFFLVVRRSLFEADVGSQSLGFFWGASVASFTFMPFDYLLVMEKFGWCTSFLLVFT